MIDKKLIKNISTNPGVYFWKDKDGNIIYVGKAKNLRSRMSQYFDPKMQNSFKTPAMLEKIFSFETTVFNTEDEACIFERKCIKKYNPKYNVILPTQANFPYICIYKKPNDLKIELRNKYKKEKNCLYYGPIIQSKKYKLLSKYLTHLLKTKDGFILKKMSPLEIDLAFEKAKEILNFNKDFKSQLIEKINFAANNYDFERASELKEILELIENKNLTQNIELKTKKSIDVFGIFIQEDKIFISILYYRFSSLINKKDFQFELSNYKDEFILNFIEDYYKKAEIPEIIVIEDQYKDLLFTNEIKDKINKNNSLNFQKLLSLATENAKNDITNKIKKINNNINIELAINDLKNILEVDPNKFVIFDNSFQAKTKEIVGRAMVFHNGIKVKKYNRNFILNKNKSNNSDFNYMLQNVSKFFSDPNLANEVNLIFVDGSFIQISAAHQALKKLNVNLPIFGLIKNDKHLFDKLINEKNIEIIINNSNTINYLTNIQFEIDKEAKRIYNKRHNKKLFESLLTNIKGLGPKTEEKLLEKFATYQNIISANIEELSKYVSIEIAKEIKKIKL
ncbi:GIY-YIG nuclease family protein [Mycoplasmopsis arginini]|uniref:GIY-YIG nuclease family protein n=1 Tax=Mycoplasmopsis arginini TaxID=2094 RepID=UPI00227C062B|nr:GIY-YIG nuclease family protein [Mycoplasmopsis arginini]MCY2903000.1 GIY-YIG nuclease family protein [Mycoplasmopsis arginini QMP CG1-2758]MDI3350417.1 GIY-YIG nuclease family protein [Mycoplasmopsis arginini]MDI3351000.1 GIY-YIG nuclease family protein [Mycoplasmopsis arginini]MDI3352681.1 GIY-YIG nuclease family protein [Mycoplasmopsis arginini]